MNGEDWPQLSQVNWFGLWSGSGLKGSLQRVFGLALMFLLSPALFAAEVQVIRAAFFKGEIMLALETLNTLASGIQFYLTTFTFVLYRRALTRTITLIDELNTRIMAELGELAKTEIKKRKDFGKKAYKVFIWTWVILVQSWSITPIFNFLLYSKRGYAVNSWVPFDKEVLIGYLGNYFFQLPVCWCYCMGLCMFGSLFVSVSEIIFGHFIILRHRLENVKFGEARTFGELVNCIKYQNDILGICSEFQELTFLPLIVNCVFTVLVLCIILVNFTSTENPSLFIVVNLIAEAQLVLMFLGTYCWYCNENTFQYSEILRPPYLSDWYNGSDVEKKLVLNIMTRTMKPMYFGGFFKIDMIKFLNILKAAFSYYNIIIAVKDKHINTSVE